ncbi:beta-ketoacyl-[acyl-carrier-protein] synthase family protein [Streptomyces sp. NPDC051577]|uniref:beta-ketoacyl-[acyl-carrier-protein] synthase family protein n=1 Tax=Streptomyces sp. NPDC051577 TaxID=3155166 RepID=UPI00342BC083
MSSFRHGGPIAVTGLGLVSPAGMDVDSNWKTILSGISAAAEDPRLGDIPYRVTCRAPDFDAPSLLGRDQAWRLDRFVQLALLAARQAVSDAGLDRATWDGTRVAVVIGSSMGGTATFECQHVRFLERGATRVSPMVIPMTLMNMVSGQVAIDLGAHGPSLTPSTACASGATAIGIARDLLSQDRCDIAIAGASESCLSPFAITGLKQMNALANGTHPPSRACRPFDADRSGLVMGEAAGILVLERPADAQARGVPPRALITGFGASTDAFHPTAPDPSGKSAALAVHAALLDAGLGPGDVEHVNAHGTSTRLNDASEARLIARVYSSEPSVTSTKGVTGHTLAASGAIEAAYTVLSIQHGLQPPTANLSRVDDCAGIDLIRDGPRHQTVRAAVSHSFGFGGHNGVLVIQAT